MAKTLFYFQEVFYKYKNPKFVGWYTVCIVFIEK